MGGWILLAGETDNFSNQFNNFKNKFSVPGVPPLYLESTTYNNTFRSIIWSWSKPPVPDIVTVTSLEGSECLILHGIITGLGRFGDLVDSQKRSGFRILELWNKKRENLFSELNGSFSCAFFSVKENSISLATDRFASRPVWFSKEGKCWYISNFPAAISSLLNNSPDLNAAGLWSLFAYSRHVDIQGIYHGMINIPAAHKVEIALDGSFEMSHWWTRQYDPKWNVAPKEWGERIAHKIKKSVKRYSRQVSNPNLLLSGGLDSRIVASAYGTKIITHTLTSSYNMNARISEKVANHLNIEHHTIFRSPYWYLESYPAASLIGGGNYNVQHAHFLVPVQNIKNSSPVSSFLLGDLLENFNKHYIRPLNNQYPDYIPERIPSFFHKIYPYCHNKIDYLKRLFRHGLGDKMYDSWKQAIIIAAKSNITVANDPKDCFDSLFRWNNCSCCPTYLMLECMWPLASQVNLMFDNELSNLLLRIPADIRGRGILHKWILWHLSKPAVFMPDSNSWLPVFFPNNLHKLLREIRPVVGYTWRNIIKSFSNGKNPIEKTEGSWQVLHEWYRKDKKYKIFIEDCLFDKDTLPHEIFNHKEIKKCWLEFLGGKISNKFEIDMLISFGLLHKKLPSSGNVIF